MKYLILLALGFLAFSCKSDSENASEVKAARAVSFEIEITSDTVFKTSTAQSSTLADSEMCSFSKGTKIKGSSYKINVKGHWGVHIPSSSCHFKNGYFYLGHIKADGRDPSSGGTQPGTPPSGRVPVAGSPRSAVLSMIGWAEGTTTIRSSDNGYNVKFGGSLFSSYQRFPAGCIRFGNTCSTAAGRYQFLDNVWTEVMGRNSTIYPADQDTAAIKRMRTMRRFRNHDQKLSYSQFLAMLDKISCEWASLPNSRGRSCYPGQPKKSISALWAQYNSNL